jgi:hypothetical protein
MKIKKKEKELIEQNYIDYGFVVARKLKDGDIKIINSKWYLDRHPELKGKQVKPLFIIKVVSK